MDSWKIWIYVANNGEWTWKPMQSSSGDIYHYASEDAAMMDAKKWYPLHAFGSLISVSQNNPDGD